MAKTRRKSNGCTRGRYKPKRMGKGWLSSHQPKRGPAPVVRREGATDTEAGSKGESNAKSD